MSLNRIQKLLFSEYCDFEDMVLVESPFAQTTRDGLGLRQIQLGLTPTKLVLAADVLPPVNESGVHWKSDTDPEIETLELIAIYPVECVNLSVFRRRKRQSLKAHFCNNRVLYFELGGFEQRKMFWNLWCERVKFLCPEEVASSVSETSVATSTSNSTLQLVSSNKKLSESGKTQLWCTFSTGEEKAQPSNWIDKYLYLDGIEKPDLEMISKLHQSEMPNIQLEKIESNEKPVDTKTLGTNTSNSLHVPEHKLVNSVHEGCGTGMFLSVEECIVPTQPSDVSNDSADVYNFRPIASYNVTEISETAVKNWEMGKKALGSRGRHPRRYGLVPQSHFLHGLGPWTIHTGDRVSTQMKRSVSAVRIRRQPENPDLSLSISKRLLTVSVSCEAFHLARGLNVDTCVNKLAVPENNVLLFWTPEYWYRPQPARDSYIEFLNYINNLRQNLELSNKGIKHTKKKKFGRKKNRTIAVDDIRSESHLQRLRAALKIEVALTAWDFDSTTLAYQLTMIDTELFLKIQPYELQVIVWQRCSKNTPNINSLIAFSHRIACLVTTEILRESTNKARARLVVRFINVADKCDRIASFHSCRSILSGLQSIPVYRLHHTWAYLRQHHAMKYQLFEKLCRRYSDPRLMVYQKSFYVASLSAPYLPYIGDIFERLLDKVSPLTEDVVAEIIKEQEKLMNQLNAEKDIDIVDVKQDFIKKVNKKLDLKSSNEEKFPTQHKFLNFFSVFKLWQTSARNTVPARTPQTPKEENQRSEIIQNKSKFTICQVQPVKVFEDNRIQRLQEATRFLDMCQKSAAKYALNKNELAREYLLKARYREDRENFYNSFIVEPKITFV